VPVTRSGGGAVRRDGLGVAAARVWLSPGVDNARGKFRSSTKFHIGVLDYLKLQLFFAMIID
jgi:hypothetical protein